MSATLIASARPAMASRRGRRSRKSASLTTAKGGTKVPRKFLAPKALIPFFTPTPESFWPSTVVGHPHRAQPAVGGGGGVSGGVDDRPAPDDQHVGVAVDAVPVKQLVQAVDDARVGLGRPHHPGSPTGGATSSRLWACR